MSEQTLNLLPEAGSAFLETLNTFLQQEDAARFALMFGGFVFAGGHHGTGAGLVGTPIALVAFPGGYYITESGSITYANNSTTWVIAHKDTVGNIGGYTRVAGTHYLTAVVSTPLPADCIRLMKVTTAAGAITVVLDQVQLSPIVNKTDFPYVRLIGTETDAKDMRIVEAVGDLIVQVNIGTEDETLWQDRLTIKPFEVPLTLDSTATVARTQQFPDKDGIFAMLSDISSSSFLPGTRLLFDNDTAPAGWVRDAVIDDRVVRIVVGARDDGGSWTVSGLTASGHALTIAEMPAHTHLGESGAAFAMLGGGGVATAGTLIGAAGNTASAGSGNQHTHNIASDANWRPLHRDVIVCEKS